MKSYEDRLEEQFEDLVINLVRHDTSPTGLPCYIEAHLGKTPKDKGSMVLDLGNYIYRRFGLRYQMTPEYRGRGKKTTLRWFMSWSDLEPVIPLIYKAMTLPRAAPLKADHHLPFEFHSLIIQNTARGVSPRPLEESKQ
jgi:hypothetical protein